MLLLGERDIYDFAVGVDTDKRYTYTRGEFNLSEPSGVPNNPFLSALSSFSFDFKWTRRYSFSRDTEPLPAFLVFCGSIYHCAFLPNGQVVWTASEILDYCASVGLELHTKKPRFGTYYRGITADYLKEFLEPKKLTKDVNDWLISEKVVQAFIVKLPKSRKINWWVNTNALKTINFFKVMEPFSIYQEIEQYVTSSMASDADKMVKLTDVEKRAKAGFDDRSFKHRK